MVTTISETISGFDFFYCEKSSCRLKIEACLKRQEADRSAVAYNRAKFDFCRDCSQGAKIKELTDSTGSAKPRKPSTGSGKKDVECPFYSGCLDYVTKECWEAFNCESCDFFNAGSKETPKASKTTETVTAKQIGNATGKTIQAVHKAAKVQGWRFNTFNGRGKPRKEYILSDLPENVQKALTDIMKEKTLCKKCGQKPVVNRFSKYCPSCLNSFRKSKNKATGAPKLKKTGKGKAKPKKASKTPKTAATEKLCKQCGENPTIHQNSPYCSACLHGMKKAKQNCQGATKEQKKEPDKVKPEKDLKSDIEGGMIIVYFGQYGSILKEVEKLAEREIRPVEMQIIYMLNNQLKAGA